MLLNRNYYSNHHAKFDIDRTIITRINFKKELTVPDIHFIKNLIKNLDHVGLLFLHPPQVPLEVS